MSIKKLVKSIKNYKSKKPVIINKYLDPSMFWVASNSAYVFAADKTLDLISQKVDSNEGLAMVGAYAALISGWGLVNKFVINPVTSKIKGFHNRRVQNETTVNGLSVIRSIGQIGSLVALYTLLNFNATINNFKGDVARVVNAFSREEQNPKIEEVVDRILPEYSVRKNGGPFSTGSLEGRTLGGLYSDYTGISGIVPKTVIIDFDAQLKNLWARKI